MDKKRCLVYTTDGLCNKLIMIINSIFLGHVKHRDIQVVYFELDFTLPNTNENIENIINLPHWNNLLDTLGIQSRLLESKHPIPTNTIPDLFYADKCSFFYTFNEWCTLLDAENSSVLSIKRPFCAFPPYNLADTSMSLYRQFRFNEKWYTLAHQIKSQLFKEDEKYQVLHLRLEPYSLTIPTISKLENIHMFDTYIKNTFQKDDLIYVCTGINKPGSKDSIEVVDFYKNLRREYPRMMDSIPLIEKIPKDEKGFHGKEAYAILDFILAVECDVFHSCRGSSFCDLITRQRHPKQTQLIN